MQIDLDLSDSIEIQESIQIELTLGKSKRNILIDSQPRHVIVKKLNNILVDYQDRTVYIKR